MILVPPFKVLGSFEGGGLGQLLKCQDANGTLFAAKFPKDHTPESQQLILDEERRFWRHQGTYVVEYYGTVRHSDGRRGFAMELMEGSLSARALSWKPLSRSEIVAYFSHAAVGLAEVHRSAPGAFHGDLKLANILVKNGGAKLADFGLARGGPGQTQMIGPHRGGTPGYFPPEGFASAAGDVYSLGVVLWALLVRREPPKEGPNSMPALPAKLNTLLKSMLERDCRRRISIEAVLSHLPSLAAEAETDPTIAVPGWLKAVGAVAAVFSVVAVLGALFSGKKG